MNVLKFTDAELQIVHAGLLEIRVKDALPVLQSIEKQLLAAAAEADKLKEEAKCAPATP